MVTPTEILRRRQRPDRWTGWIPTLSGSSLSILAPNPANVHYDDIVWGLGHTYRYGGQSSPLVTIAEHCIIVSHIIKKLWPKTSKAIQLGGLFHDTSEAYTHDIQAPLRQILFLEYPDGRTGKWSEFDRKLNDSLTRILGLNPATLEAPEVKAADILAVCIEKIQVPTLGTEDWGLPPLPDELRDFQMQFLDPDAAMVGFRSRAQELGFLPPSKS